MSPTKVQLTWRPPYWGPNPLASSSVVVADLHSEILPGTKRIEAAFEVLWQLSGMQRTGLARNVELADSDALLAMAWQAVGFARAVLSEVRGDVQHADAARNKQAVSLWLGFHQPELSRAVLLFSFEALIQNMNGALDASSFRTKLECLWQECRRLHPDYQARILQVGARAMHVPYLRYLPGSRYWQFGWGAKARVFMESASNDDGALGWQWQKDKATSKALMNALGLPAPVHAIAMQEDDLVSAVQRVGLPCVVKPLNLGGGKGVTANLTTLEEVRNAFRAARQFTEATLIVEAHVRGDDHRLLVIDGKMVGVIRRQPSFVVGDGAKTVRTLVA